MLYNGYAYDSTRYSVRPSADIAKGRNLAKQFAEENNALGGSEYDSIVRENLNQEFVKMTIPDWFCEVICGGLNLDDIGAGEGAAEKGTEFANVNESKLFDTEEEFHLHRGRVGFDKSLSIPKDSSPGE